MLTAELIRVRVNKERELQPSFLDVTKPANIERADELVEIFRGAQARGLTLGELRVEVEDLIGDGIDVKVVRGLAKVLEDVAEWTAEPAVPSDELRRRLFERVGPTPSIERANEVWAELAVMYERPVEELRRALFGDRKDEQTLRAFEVPDGAWRRCLRTSPSGPPSPRCPRMSCAAASLSAWARRRLSSGRTRSGRSWR